MIHKLRSFLLNNRKIRNIVQKNLDAALLAVYCASSPTFHRLAFSWLIPAWRRWQALRRGKRLFVSYLEGSSRVDHQPLRVGVIRQKEHALIFLRHFIFDDLPVTVDERPPAELSSLRHTAESLAEESDLLVCDVNSEVTWRPTKGSWIVGPSRLRMVMVFPRGADWETVRYQMRGQHKNLKLIQKSGFSMEISRDEQDFDLFYTRYYLPFMAWRHPETGHVHSREYLEDLFHKGVILFVCTPEKERLAAGLLMQRGKTLFGMVTAVRDGDEAIVRQGALSAVTYFTTQWAFQTGMRRCDVGEVANFVEHGLTIHKQRWGYQAIIDPWNTQDLLAWAPKNQPAALSWMAAAPMLEGYYVRGGEPAETPPSNLNPVEGALQSVGSAIPPGEM